MITEEEAQELQDKLGRTSLVTAIEYWAIWVDVNPDNLFDRAKLINGLLLYQYRVHTKTMTFSTRGRYKL